MLTGVELALLLTDTIELCEGHERLRERLEFPYSKHQLRSASVCPWSYRLGQADTWARSASEHWFSYPEAFRHSATL